jgi:diguanylate cyclase (GGDEF)-like protein
MSRLLKFLDVLSPMMAAALMVSGTLFVGALDLVTGVEIRVYPLYFLPLSVGAWTLGRRGAWVGSLIATATWYASNRVAGMTYSSPSIWGLNLAAQALAFVTVSSLIARMRSMFQREAELARTDLLTGMHNRRAFCDLLEQFSSLARRHQRPLTLAYIDLDNFKCANDQFGHAHGDELLRTVAQTIHAGLRSSDFAARLGGDEFVVCLPDTGEAAARAVLERLCASIEAALHAPPCGVSASIGAVAWSTPPATSQEIMRGADDLMYEVKRAGKNSVRVVLREPD